MKNVRFVLLVVTMIVGMASGKAQNENRLDNYKYVVIPMQFSFQHKENEYLLNSRIKHLFDQEGYHTIMEDSKYPDDLSFNRCLALYVALEINSDSFFSTYSELQIILKNCRNEVVYKSKKGRSKSKDLKISYKEALQDAFTSFYTVYYKYNGNKGVEDAEGKQTDLQEKEMLASPMSRTLGKEYERVGKIYEVNKIEAGYVLLEKNTGKRQAFITTTEDHSILYNSKEINGKATVSQTGDISVEYFDQAVGEMKKIMYRVREN